jgi:hypothetical protein
MPNTNKTGQRNTSLVGSEILCYVYLSCVTLGVLTLFSSHILNHTTITLIIQDFNE